MEYPKIYSVFKRDTEHKLLLGEYSRPEFEYLADCQWTFTEKIDGINIRVVWDGEQVSLCGRTDRAQIRPELRDALMSRFPYQKFINMDPLTVYGEGYGARIWGGGKYIPDGVDFVVFDVRVGHWWLKRIDVGVVARDLGVAVVPEMGSGTLHELVSWVSQGVESNWGPCEAEGIVARPAIELQDRAGRCVITKLKCRDFARG